MFFVKNNLCMIAKLFNALVLQDLHYLLPLLGQVYALLSPKTES